jgi:hypothetical protein
MYQNENGDRQMSNYQLSPQKGFGQMQNIRRHFLFWKKHQKSFD